MRAPARKIELKTGGAAASAVPGVSQAARRPRAKPTERVLRSASEEEMQMGRSILIATLFCSFVVAGPALCKDYVAMGAGTVSCGKFAKDYASAPDEFSNFYFAWAQGYMSGINLAIASETKRYRNLAGMPTDQQERFLRAHCNQHPLGDFADGVIELYDKLPLAAMPAKASD